MSTEQQNLSGPMTVLSMVNGMIGGLILLLPVMALQAGWLVTLIALVVTGLMSYYSCYLCILHTGNQPDLDVSIQKHFWNSKKMKIFYQICILSNLFLIVILYFELIVIQWIGIAPPYHFTHANPVINAFVLLILVFIIKYREFGANLMAYGIISIASYLVFVTWVAASQDTSSKNVTFVAFGNKGIQLAAALGQGYAIQSFFIPIIKKNTQTKRHKYYLILAFILGGIAYSYIAFVGSYGILYRQFLADSDSQRTIEGYFGIGNWQVNALEVIYLVHLYSVFPQYLLIGKKRFFSIFGIKQSQSREINRQQLIYIVVAIFICMIMALLRISLREIIDFNGAVIGFFFIYFFPLGVHFKCKYMKKEKILTQQPRKEQNYNEMIQQKDCPKDLPLQSDKQRQFLQKDAEGLDEVNTEGKYEGSSQKKTRQLSENIGAQQIAAQASNSKEETFTCIGDQQGYSKRQKILQIGIMSVMFLLGTFTLFDGIKDILFD